ncbi:hypothetical protein OUZ56_005926 [Daphnia magna]|uniref:Uncharacterized protein n=1 Tax=Daphnia magna TaxID=35525 RepID=A0ABQ9YU50_9CRUS|nr:hypothetical protein OUZ56_005926 [Daphnia magna]
MVDLSQTIERFKGTKRQFQEFPAKPWETDKDIAKDLFLSKNKKKHSAALGYTSFFSSMIPTPIEYAH